MSVMDYPVPADALDDLKNAVIHDEQIQAGATRHHLGHANGIAFRFYTVSELSIVKSEMAGFPVYYDIDVVEFFNNKGMRPAHRLDKMNGLREEVVFKVDPKTGEVEKDYLGKPIPMRGVPTRSHPYGEILKRRVQVLDDKGRFAALPKMLQGEYVKWKEGRHSGSTPIESWPSIEPHQRRAFLEMQILSVEQLASLPNPQAAQLPPSLREAFDLACEWVAKKEGRVMAEEHMQQLLEAKQEIARQNDTIAQLSAAMKNAGLIGEDAPKTKSRKKEKKNVDQVLSQSRA